MVHAYRFVFNASLFGGLLAFCPAPDIEAQDTDIEFENISSQHGLSHPEVTAIEQDHYGFMWFGTRDGLNRFDGYEFTVFKHDARDSNSIPNNNIACLLEDSGGILWIGTNGSGLCSFDEQTGRFRRNPLNSGERGNRYVRAIAEGRDGILWIGADSLLAVDRRSGTVIPHTNVFPDGMALGFIVIRALLEDRSGTLWVGSWFGGLFRIDRDRRSVSVFRNDPANSSSLSENHVISLLEDTDGELWCGTYTGGLNRFKSESRTFLRYPRNAGRSNCLNDNTPHSLYEDHLGRLWVGTYGGGLNILDKKTGRVTYLVHNESVHTSLSNDYVSAIYEDDAGTVWLATTSGISKYSPSRNRIRYLAANSASGHFPMPMTSLCEDRYGGLWLAGDKGVTRYMRGTNTSKFFSSDSSNPLAFLGTYVSAIYEDRLGFMWFGTIGDGASRYDPRTGHFRRFRIESSDPGRNGNSVDAFFEDSAGRLWFLTARGIALCDRRTDRLTYYGSYATIRRRDPMIADIICMLEERPGVYWLGTEFGGLIEYSPKDGVLSRCEHIESDPNSIADNNISILYKDRKGKLWLGTTGGGIDEFDPITRTARHITERNGLPSNIISGILEDGAGNLWISTRKGIAVFNPSSGSVRAFGAEEGILDIRDHSSVMSRTGEMIFCNGSGLFCVNPSDIRINPNAPPVVLTGFSVLNEPFPLLQPVHVTRTILLDYMQNFFTFEFAALDFSMPQKNRYMYKLDGIDEEWVDAGNRRRANYTHLPPGSYVFRVKGSNSDGVWNEKGLSVVVEITPPFWKTWWFRVSLVLALAGMIMLAHNYRVNKLLEIERVRVRIARDLHDELGSNLSGIALASRLVQDSPNLTDQQRQRLSEVSENAKLTADAMREIVWFINPENDRSTDLVLKMKEMAYSMLQGVDVVFTAGEDVFARVTNIETRRHVFLIYKEILNNIVRHSRCTAVDITLVRQSTVFRMSVTDNGAGFNSERRSPGNGLRNLQARAGEIGGSLEIKSSPGRGTSITLEAKTT